MQKPKISKQSSRFDDRTLSIEKRNKELADKLELKEQADKSNFGTTDDEMRRHSNYNSLNEDREDKAIDNKSQYGRRNDSTSRY